MAILKDLIVHGSSRFLNKIYASEIQTPLIEAEAGIFKKLKADDATVVGLLDVKGQLHTNSWSNSNIATIDGSFYITPTIGSASGTVAITASSLTFSGTNYAISSLYLGDGSSITWPQYSKVLVTGQILSNGEWIPLGTLLGQLSSAATAASISINNIKDNKNQTSNVLTTLVNEGTISSNYRNLKVSLYQRASSSTAFYPLGIYMTAVGDNGRTFLDIYGGVNPLNTTSSNYGGFAEPNVRIGNLQGLPNVGGQSPNGWGIYTDNGYFKGIIAADRGYIGTGSKYWVIENYEDGSNSNNDRSYIYNGTNSTTSTIEGVYLGTDGIRNYKDSTHYVTIKNGVISALGVDLTGAITATSGEIGGASIANGVLYITDANISGTISGNHIDASSISIGSLNGASNYAQKTDVTQIISKYIIDIDTQKGIKITPYDKSGNDYLQINSNAISMYRNNIETLKIEDDNIRVGKIGTDNRNIYITNNAVQIRNNTTILASYGDSIILGNENSLSQITLSQTGVIFTPKTVAGSTENAGTFKYIVNEFGHSYTLVEESASNQSDGTATKDPLRLNNNIYYSNTESFSQVILAKINNVFQVLGKISETETFDAAQSIEPDSETWNYNSTPITKTTVTYTATEEMQEIVVEQEDGSEEIENIIVYVNYKITRVESWEKWNVTTNTILEDYIYSGYIKKDPSDETNQDLYSISYQKKGDISQSNTETTLNVNVSTDITTSLSFRQMTNFYEYKNFNYVTTEPDFSILFGKDVWTNSPYAYILGGEKNVIKTNSTTIPALYSTIVGGYQNGYFYNRHSDSPSLEDTLRKMGIECFIGNGYGNSVQSNLSSIVGGQYNAIYDGESFSIIGGGYNNSIQTWYDDTVSGNTNFYNAPYQFLGGGKDNSSRSDYGVLVGGYNNTNLGKYSVISGGASNKTVGQYSVITGGNNNIVLGENSYAHGYLNIAKGNNQTVLGRANIPDLTSLLIVGNGTNSSNRSNALTLSQGGSLTIAMDLNLHSSRSISLAQKSDYVISPSDLMKSNRLYANQYDGSMNNYYISQGYHSFYGNGSQILSLRSSEINSAVPLEAPNNLQWIDNTNNISRANVIYYGSPSTSDHPTATANQPANGWYYYRQFAASSGYNILLGVGMNNENPTLRIRGRYKDVSTNTYNWSSWKTFSMVGHKHAASDITSGTLSIARGGTGSTGTTYTETISSVVTKGTNITISNARYAQWGKIAQISLVLKTTAALSGNTVVATLVNGKHPQTFTGATVNYDGTGMIYTNGAIHVNKSYASGTTLNIEATYILP